MAGIGIGLGILFGSGPIGTGADVNAAKYADYAWFIDAENGLAAAPADMTPGAVPVRGPDGRYPKVAVPFTDLLQVRHYAGVWPGVGFEIGPWWTYQDSAWRELGDNEPRIENWMGYDALQSCPAVRFNRIPDADTEPFPYTATLSRSSGTYTATWFSPAGDAVITASCTGHASTVLTSTRPGFNWGYVPGIEGWGGAGTVFTLTSGTAHSLNVDIPSNQLWGPSGLIPTSQVTEGEIHVDRAPEHVGTATALTAFLRDVNDGGFRLRTGTLIFDQQQFVVPFPGNWSCLVATGEIASGTYGPTIHVAEDNGDYLLRHNTSSNNSNLQLAVTASDLTSRRKIGISVNNTTGAKQRRFGMQGVGVVSTGVDANYHLGAMNDGFYFNGFPQTSSTDYMGDNTGSAQFAFIGWMPDYLSEAALEAVLG